MEWSLRYSFHTGYEPPHFRSQFHSTLGSDDPVALVHFAASQGVAGVLYPWAAQRDSVEVDRVAGAIKETRLANSCVLIGDASLLFRPIWMDRSASGRALLRDTVESACRYANVLNADIIVAFPMSDDDRLDQLEQQQEELTANMADMARVAQDYGCKIGIEPMAFPGLSVQSLDTALTVARGAGGGVGIVFDTAHIAHIHGDLAERFDDAFDDIILLQLADLPGRVEPGAGRLDLVSIAARSVTRGYAGLVDLEHGWANLSAAGESEGLARVQLFDDNVRAAIHAWQSQKSGD